MKYRIEMLAGSNAINEQIVKELLQECGVIRRMLIKSITTAKGKCVIKNITTRKENEK